MRLIGKMMRSMTDRTTARYALVSGLVNGLDTLTLTESDRYTVTHTDRGGNGTADDLSGSRHGSDWSSESSLTVRACLQSCQRLSTYTCPSIQVVPKLFIAVSPLTSGSERSKTRARGIRMRLVSNIEVMVYVDRKEKRKGL
jgi:hypothetical protein